MKSLLRLLPLLFLLAVACRKEEPEPTPAEPEEPAEEEVVEADPLHEKEIPASFTLPSVYINTERRQNILSKDEYVNASFHFEDLSGFYTDNKRFSYAGRIKGRGNTTWSMSDKKPYRIKLDEKARIFTPYKNRDWILLANYSDKTLLRNITAMEISRILGMAWTPYMLSVNVYINDQYRGVYTFSDHKEVAGRRVDIEVVQPEDTDITGDYYLEVEANMDEPVCFKTLFGAGINFHEPEYPTEAQLAYIQDWFTGLENSLSAIRTKQDYTTWRRYADEASFIDYYLIQELTKNPDGGVYKSTFLTKERGKPLRMYHVWDFDIALGNCNYYEGQYSDPTGFVMRNQRWYNYLFLDPTFIAAVKKRWKEVYPALKGVPDFIDRQHALMAGAETANFQTWPILGKYVWPNQFIFNTYTEELNFLKQFVSERIDWMNRAISYW